MFGKHRESILLGLGVVIVIAVSLARGAATDPPQVSAPEPVVEESKESPAGSISDAELIEFDNAVLKLDPEEKLIRNIAKANEIVADVTVTAGFATMPAIKQNEVAIAMRDALANICECSPYLKFETEKGQRIVEIGKGKPKRNGTI